MQLQSLNPMRLPSPPFAAVVLTAARSTPAATVRLASSRPTPRTGMRTLLGTRRGQ